MSAQGDRAEEVAQQAYEDCTHGSDYEDYGPCLSCVAAALRAYAEEARREERSTAAIDAEMRYADGYECGVADEREAVKGTVCDECRKIL